MFFTSAATERGRSFSLFSFQRKDIAGSDHNRRPRPIHSDPQRAAYYNSTKDTGSQFSSLYDAFHLPFPANAEQYIVAPLETTSQPGEGRRLGLAATSIDQIHRSDRDHGDDQVDEPIFRRKACF